MKLFTLEESTQVLFQAKVDHCIDWFAEAEKIVDGVDLEGRGRFQACGLGGRQEHHDQPDQDGEQEARCGEVSERFVTWPWHRQASPWINMAGENDP